MPVFIQTPVYILVKRHTTHLLSTAQTQLENNHHLMYVA